MKNNILNYAKKSLSITLALALLAISLFTGVSINTKAADAVGDTWDGTYSEPATTDDAGNIIITNAEELAWVVLKSGAAGAGKTYKVKDGIKSFYMNENTADLTLEQVKNELDGNNINSWDYQSNPFQATLDGNGVTIYGLYSEGANNTAGTYGGLVPIATGTVAVKNLAVKNSYIGGYKYSSAIIGYANSTDGLISLTVEQCVVTNNYIIQTRTSSTNSLTNYSVGAIGGGIDAYNNDPRYVTVNNCLVYENELYSALGGNISGIFAYFRAKSTNVNLGYYKFTNLIISGAAPWNGIDNSQSRSEKNFVNVYTDTDKTGFTYDGANTGTANGYGTLKTGSVELLDTANMKGTAAESNMPALDWENTWTTTENSFPELKLFCDEPTTDDGEQDALNIVYWDGTKTAPDETNVDSDGNIIISTAAELNYIATTESSGKSYKIADGIDVMILQPEASVDAETLMGLADYEAVKTYLTETITATAWCNYSSDPPKFNSSFDGNGVEIYGLYGIGTNVGLFPGIDGGTVYTTDGHTGNTFQNFAVRNSCLISSRRIGVIGAYCATGMGVGTVNVKNCEVSNCYIESTTTNTTQDNEQGVLVGRTYRKEFVHIENCLVYGNYNYSTGLNKQIPLYSGGYTSDENLINTVENSIVLGTAPYPTSANLKTHGTGSFENVCTDQNLPTYTTYTDTDIKKISTDDILGSAAKTVMPGLDWNKTWITVDGDYPALRTFCESSSEIEDGDDTPTDTIETWDGTIATAFASGTGTKDDPYIIQTAEQLAYLVSGAGGTTGGNYYKVADSIKAFDMNGFEGITLDSTLDDVKEATKTGLDWSATFNESNAFCGVFDGNYATVYNLYGKKSAMGLFPCVKGYGGATGENVTIKNITVKNSYFEATGSGYNYGAGGIFGKHTNLEIGYPVTINKCAVINCYLTNTNTSAEAYVGAIGGTVRWATAVIDNCLVADNEIVGGNVSTGGLVAAAQNTSAITVSNCVVIGTTPYPTGTQGTGITSTDFTDLIAPASYSNIYTDQTVGSAYTGITTLTRAQMTDSAATNNMTLLDWGSNWKIQENSYPIPFSPAVAEGVWDGEAATDYAGGDGTEENPFIIKNISQLYKMVKDGGEDASGNAAYFKVKDGVYDLYANPIESMLPGEVKAYFADPTTYKAVWDPQTTEFNGHFDGNGVNIHGLYNVKNADSAGVAFLPRVSGSKAFIKNVQFSDCHFENTATTYNFWTSAAVLVARSDNSDIEFTNVAVCNSTAICKASAAAVFVAVNGATVTIDTAFTCGNTLYSEHYYSESLTYTYEGILYGETQGYLYTIKNSVFTETDEYMSRVHYKVSIKFENSYVAGLTASSITGIVVSKIPQSSMIGSAAQENMPDLDWTDWILTDSYPVIAALHDLTYTTTGDIGHTVTCKDCDLSISLESHNYNSNYVCTLCKFEHSHTLVDDGIDYDSTCVDDGVMNVKCEYCDYTSTRVICAKKHTFGDTIPASAGDCQTEATVAYKTCSTCDLCFTPDADVTSTTPLDHIGTGYTARHDWVEQDALTSECSGVDSIPYFKCSVCDTYLVEGVMSTTAPTKIEGHTASSNYYVGDNYHANICTHCGEHFNETEHTDENTDSICEICGWPCGESVFDGASITLTDSIAVNYMINKNVIENLGYSDIYIKFTFGGREYTVRDYEQNGEYCIYTFDKIAPNRMGDIIYATFCGCNGESTYYSKTIEYSVKQYCTNILNTHSGDQYAELRTLLVDLLNYGAQSQIYTNYNVDSLANDQLTEEQKAFGTQDARDLETVQDLKYETIENPTVKWMGAGLYLDEAATMRFTIKADNISGLTVRVVCDGKTWDIPASEFVKRTDVGNGEYYYVYVEGIPVTQMSDEVLLTVYKNDTIVSNTIRYSIESYAYKMSSGSDAELQNLLVAMIKYGDAAKNYANKQ